jgi:hypothetical protein
MNTFRKSNTQKSRSSSCPPPAQVNKTETPINKSNGNSFTDSIVSGFGLGLGSSIAHKMTDSIFTKTNENTNKTNDTENEKKNV